jgi:hypothetical protein
MASPDLLFNLRNLFYLGAYQAAINNSDVPGLDADAAAERDAIVFRSYVALGSYQVSSAPFPSPSVARSLYNGLAALIGACPLPPCGCCSW